MMREAMLLFVVAILQAVNIQYSAIHPLWNVQYMPRKEIGRRKHADVAVEGFGYVLPSYSPTYGTRVLVQA